MTRTPVQRQLCALLLCVTSTLAGGLAAMICKSAGLSEAVAGSVFALVSGLGCIAGLGWLHQVAAEVRLDLMTPESERLAAWKRRATAHFARKYGLSQALASKAAERAWPHILERHGGNVDSALSLDAEILNYDWILKD